MSSPNSVLPADWDDLVRRASPNVFMHPAALNAACETGFSDIQMLLAWEQGDTGARTLVGVWALQVRKVTALWPALLEALPYNYAFLSSPVIDPARVDDVIPAFFALLKSSRALPGVVSMKSLDAESPTYAAIQRAVAAQDGGRYVMSESVRPIVTRDFGVKRSGSTRKKLRQDWNRLSALGPVDVVNDRNLPAVAEAFEVFLALEQASWKGQRGTALLCDTRDAAFARRMVADLAQRGNASVALLRVDTRPVAAQVLMYCGATAYTWKTAFDATYAKFSPGALLIDKITDEMFAIPGIDTIDSCSAEGGFMAQLWSGRRAMVDLLVNVGPGRSLLFRMEVGRQRLYEALRRTRDRVRASQAARRAKIRGQTLPPAPAPAAQDAA